MRRFWLPAVQEGLKSALEWANVRVRDVDSLTRKIQNVVSSGPAKLMVFADFDMTLTSFTCANGRPGETSYGVIESSSRMPKSFRDEILQVKNRYYPIEIAKDVSIEQRTQAMVEWWRTSNALMLKYHVKKSDIKVMVADANITLRPKADDVFGMLEQHSVPLYVLSAGLADVIHQVFVQQSKLWANMRIISNSLIYDEEGVARTFSEPLIHTFNKHHVTEFFKDEFKAAEHRPNVLLLGDSQGDPSMTDGINGVNSHSIIKIGFLNHDEDVLLSRYMDLYDVVLTGDADMTFVLTILKALIPT